MTAHRRELLAGDRFAFGANWRRYLELIDDERIELATRELATMLETERLDGRTFLDIGCGSGLSSLAARRLGAKVVAFDYDPASVATAAALRERMAPDDVDWTITEGSILDPTFVDGLGMFDIVYSWGVLHHTGDQWRALELATSLVAPGGRLFIALYNDQGLASTLWHTIKRAYNRGSAPTRRWLLAGAILWFEGRSTIGNLVRGRLDQTFLLWRRAPTTRGMSPLRDIVDWTGGYPFEVSTPAEVFAFCHQRGFALDRMTTVRGGSACNQYVFTRTSDAPSNGG
jgi:SAM-dependent methyltransferase